MMVTDGIVLRLAGIMILTGEHQWWGQTQEELFSNFMCMRGGLYSCVLAATKLPNHCATASLERRLVYTSSAVGEAMNGELCVRA